MESKSTNTEFGSQLITVVDNTANLHKAWHLLRLMLANGRTIHLKELALLCGFFRLSPDFIKFLCSIPDSPIYLTPGRSVSISSAAFEALGKALWNLSPASAFVPRSLRLPKMSCGNITKTYYRKRKRGVTGSQFLPVADIGVFLQNSDGENYQGVLNISDNSQPDWHKVKKSRAPLMQLEYSCHMTPNSDKLHKNTVKSDVPIDINVYGLKSNGEERHREDVHECIYKTDSSSKANGIHDEQQQCKRDRKLIFTEQKLNQNCVDHIHSEATIEKSKEKREKLNSTFLKNEVLPKYLPTFEFFIVEEKEGSGGYGTVYRAKRKHDGVTFAIKCPHDNANRYHLQNEQKMLEQFGGKNFIIKYEGSFKYGSADCLVLEHVKHERPEVLKREIDLFQLQWYGYCLFRALSCLHKQGVVHRDIKPGNFLFSRIVNKGYLIDFNLATDMYKKYGKTDKSAMSYGTGSDHVPYPCEKSFPPAKAVEASKQEGGKGSKSITLTKDLERKTNKTHLHERYRTKIISPGADGSGITSVKDATSTRAPSNERIREPMPRQGRKELLGLAQEAMHIPSPEVASPPSFKRRRIAALPERVDSKIIYPTPMPLHFSGAAIAGAGYIKSKGEVKNKTEGPCVGTKGFRAPEVLLRSPFQGPKIDVWSAGVTLVYLSTGRSPFVGDPEQNIVDIAKLRGSEDLWEVAKLHNRESSFPAQLLDMQYLPSKKLRDWYSLDTKRQDLLKDLPRSFFDLLDKCLTVNPRLRISAEEALRHEFFAPCHEQLKQQRLLRKGVSLKSATALHSDTQTQANEFVQC